MNKDEQKKNNGDNDDVVVLDINGSNDEINIRQKEQKGTQTTFELNVIKFDFSFERQNKNNMEITQEKSFEFEKKETKNLKNVSKFFKYSFSINDEKEQIKALNIEDEHIQFSIVMNKESEKNNDPPEDKEKSKKTNEQQEINCLDNQISNSGDIMNKNTIKTIDLNEKLQKINKDNNQSSSKSEIHEKIQYALCPNCAKYANLLLDFDNPKQLFYNCPACKNISTISIDDYIDKVKNKDDRSEHGLCTKHNAVMTCYCLSCEKYHCPRCKSQCDIQQQFNNKTKTQSIRAQLDTVKKGKFEKIGKLVSKYKKHLETIIENINNSYEKLIERNTKVYNFLQLILNSYEKYPNEKILIENYTNNFNYNQDMIPEDIISENYTTNLLNFLDNFLLVKNRFKFENYNEKIVVKKHRDTISSFLLLNNGNIASSSFDGTINIYDKDLNFVCSTNKQNENVSSMIELDSNYLISCSFDKSIRKFHINNRSIDDNNKFNNSAHDDIIYQLINLSDGNFASCSEDKTIKIWDSSISLINTLTGHTKGVKNILQTNDKEYILSISDDCTLGKWKYPKEANKKKETIISDVIHLDNCDFISSIIQADYNHVMIGSFNQVMLVDYKNETKETIINDPLYGYLDSVIEIRKSIFLFGCYDGILVYDHNNKKHCLHKTNHRKAISALLKVNKNCFISGSLDHSIRMWSDEEKTNVIPII